MTDNMGVTWFDSLQTKIIGWILLLLLSAVIISGFIREQHIIPLLEEESERLSVETAYKIAAKVDQHLEQAKSLVISLSSIAKELPQNEDIHHSLIPSLLNVEGLETFIAGGGVWPEPYQFNYELERRSFFWGRNKENDLQYYDDYNAIDGSGYKHQEWYIPAKYLNDGQVYWSRSYDDPFSYQAMVTVASPVYKANTLYGVSTVDIKLEGIQALVNKHTSELGGYGFIVDRNGRFISFPSASMAIDEDGENISLEKLAEKHTVYESFSQRITKARQAYVKTNSSPELAQKIINEQGDIKLSEALLISSVLSGRLEQKPEPLISSFVIETDAILHEKSNVIILHMADTGWYMVVVMPTSLYFPAVAKIANQITLYQALLVCFIMLLLFLIIQRLMTRPLKYITRQLRSSVNFNSNKNIVFDGNNELSLIIDLFNKRTQQLEESEALLLQDNERIKERVEDRTKELQESELKLAELASHAIEEEMRLRAMFDKAMDAVILMTSEGVVVHWNQQAEKIFGWPEGLALGRLFHELVIPRRDHPYHVMGYERYRTTGESVLLNTRTEVTAVNRDGDELQVELAVSEINYKGQHQFTVFARDLTEQKKHEQLLTRARDDAEYANKAKSLFLANMSHELRTPMHGILSFANFGQKKAEHVPREKLTQYFVNIHNSGQRLLGLLNDLLDLSKIEAEQLELEFKPNDLYKLFEQCLLEQEQRVKDLDLTVNVQVLSHKMKGNFDEMRLAQVITNLLSNAFKFSPQGMDVNVTMDVDSSKNLCFSIQDHGPGIPEEELESIFESFVQSSTTDTGAGGTGLGLSICKEIIKAHDGKVWAENHQEGGAVFKFTIPQ